jgi:hypothetical protein
LIEYSTTVPAPQPLALIEPAATGLQVLLVMVNVGTLGVVQVPGIVVTELIVLDIAVLKLQLHLVETVIAVV